MSHPLFRPAAAIFCAAFLSLSARAAEVVEMEVDEHAVTGKLKPMERKTELDIAPASDEGLLAIKRVKIAPDLQISLWASEPMLANPVAINFDEHGRLFVAETYRYRSSVLDIRDYMWTLEDELANRTLEDQSAAILKHFGPEGVKELSKETEVVRLLEDRNHDGKADFSTIYADGFNTPLDGIASGVLARKGKVWFTNIPSVWQFDGAEKAEKRTELSRGYGLRFNFTGHDLHGLIFGPDGKIYYSVGDRGAHVPTKEGGVVDSADTGSVFRCDPDGSHLELFATGLRNPQDLLFNEVGDLFTGDNDCDNGDMERLVHVVEGGDSGWRIGYQHAPLGKAGPWNLEKMWLPRFAEQPTYIIPPICNIEDGPSGIAYYPGTGLNPRYSGSIFITHFKGAIARSGIYTYNVKPKGASYELVDAKPFAISVLPTDVKFGPDGRLYYSDWADGWPKSRRGRIYAVSDPSHVNDPIVKEVQRLLDEGMSMRKDDELAKLLGHADSRVRLEAQYELADRGRISLPTLKKVAAQKDAPLYARLHAIWGLGQLANSEKEAIAAIRPLLEDATDEVRAQAAKQLGDHHVNDAGKALIAHLKDSNARVKFFAAQSLSKLALPDATEPLLALLRENNDADNYLRHVAVLGLVGSKNLPALEKAASSSSAAERMGVLLAYRRLGRPEIQRFLKDASPLLVAEAARAINDVPINEAMPALAAFIDKPVADEMVMMRAINANFRLGTPAHATALAAYAAHAGTPDRLRAETISQLAAWPKPLARDRLVGVYRPLTPATRDASVAAKVLTPNLPALLGSGSSESTQNATLGALATLKITGASNLLFALVSDEKQPASSRTAALEALDRNKDPKLAEAVRIAGNSNNSKLRMSSLLVASRLSPDSAMPVLSRLVEVGKLSEQKAAFVALGRINDPRADTFLQRELTALSSGEIAPALQLEVLDAAGKRKDPKVKELLSQYEEHLNQTTDFLAPYRVALAGGDRGRGDRLFHDHPVLACIRCHKVNSTDGGDAGPSLASAGLKYSREYLLESVVKPNAKIAAGFETIAVTLKDGSSQAGIVIDEDDTTLRVRLPDNSVAKLTKADIAKREAAPSSMPEIFAQILTKSELRDLVEYLSSLKERNSTATDEGKPRALRDIRAELDAKKDKDADL